MLGDVDCMGDSLVSIGSGVDRLWNNVLDVLHGSGTLTVVVDQFLVLFIPFNFFRSTV